MTLYPDVQARAQAEIDTVIGTDRLPDLIDHDKLPYVNALCSEVTRWMPTTPLGKCIYSMSVFFLTEIGKPSPTRQPKTTRIVTILFQKEL